MLTLKDQMEQIELESVITCRKSTMSNRAITENVFENENHFINAAYLSELWAAEDLKRKLANGQIDKSFSSQMDDEYRHAEMLRRSMRHCGYDYCDSIEYAMQNRLFKDLAGFDLTNYGENQFEYIQMHNVLERRAIVNYKGFCIGGKSETYRKLLRLIISDERSHIDKKTKKGPNSENIVFRLDQKIHRDILSKKYNRLNLLESPEFWSIYFSKNKDEF